MSVLQLSKGVSPSKRALTGLWLLLWLFGMQLSANAANSPLQTTKSVKEVKVKIGFDNKSLKEVFGTLETITEFNFVYHEGDAFLKEQFSMPQQELTVEAILLSISRDHQVAFKQVNNNISILKIQHDTERKPKVEVVIDDMMVSGKVTSGEDGTALPGVSVLVKGTSTGTITDVEGNYRIEVPENATLIFSYVGFGKKEVEVGTSSEINVVLAPDDQLLESVVVTALGIEKQSKSVGYSISEVEGESFTKSREINLGNALTGKVAGVNVANNATGASGSSRVLIRGNTSLTGNNQPLYVIDGVPFDNSNRGSAGQYGGIDLGDGLSNINPDDIESMEVLKGVAASALYGYRGGNGAILITTKSGKRNQGVGIEFNNNLTFNSIIDTRDYQMVYGQGTQGLKPTTADAAASTYRSSWGPVMDGSDAVNFLGDTYAYSPQSEDNISKFYDTGVTNQSSLSFYGGNDKGSFRLGLSNIYMDSYVPNAGLDQQGINLNSEYNITDKFQVKVNANYVFEHVDNRASLSDASQNVNASVVYTSNSFDIGWLESAVGADGSELIAGTSVYASNPYFLANYHSNQTDRNRLTGAITLRYDLLDWLYLQGQITRDGYIFNVEQVVPTGAAYQRGGSITAYEVNYHELNTNFMLGINKNLGEQFTLRANLGMNSQDNENQVYGVNNVGPFQIPYLYSVNNVANKPFSVDYSHYRVNSIFGTADIGFRDYLFLTLTGREDWFSTLDINSNNYFYPSASLSFVFSDVFNLPEWVNFGKLRGSIAQSSNGTSPYQNTLTYGLEGVTLAGQPIGYINSDNVPNANLEPVQIQEEEIGLEVDFLESRLRLDAAFYNKTTSKDIVTVTASNTSGYSGVVQNIGKIRNRGVEFLLSAIPVETNNLTWETSLNLARNFSKVLDLGDGVERISIEGAVPRSGDGVSISNVVGMPYGQIMGYAYRRDEAGNKIYDEDGEPLRSESIEALGSGVYKLTGGFNNNLYYKNFSLNVLFDFKFGAKVYSGTNLTLYSSGLHENTLEGREGGYVGEGVTEDGSVNTTVVDAQEYWQNLAGSNNIAEEFVYDASFIKLRQISIGYSLPASLLEDKFIKGLTLSLVGRNLATLLKHTPNIDPESSYNTGNGQGLELYGYPPIRSLGFNLNVKF